jgi:hypothetical protein
VRDDNDFTRGEFAGMLKEFAALFVKILAGVFIVLTIATLNGSQTMGG